MFALGTVGFGEVMPLPVVFGAAPPAAGALGLPGAVAPGLPPARPVCANAAVVISSADTIATGTNVLADILRLLLAFEMLRAPSSSRRNSSSGRIVPDRVVNQMFGAEIYGAHGAGTPVRRQAFIRRRGNAEGDRRVMSQWSGDGGNL